MALVSNHSCFEMVMLAGKYTVCDLDRIGRLRIVVPAHPTGLFDLSTASWTMVAVTGSDWQCNQPSSAIWTCTNMMWIGILIGSSSIKLAESTFELPFIWVNWQLQEVDFFIDISLMMTHVGLLKQRLPASGFAPCLSPHTEQEQAWQTPGNQMEADSGRG